MSTNNFIVLTLLFMSNIVLKWFTPCMTPALNLQLYKSSHLPHHCPNKGIKDTVVNRTCLSINGSWNLKVAYCSI